jgi:hypothetical protein
LLKYTEILLEQYLGYRMTKTKYHPGGDKLRDCRKIRFDKACHLSIISVCKILPFGASDLVIFFTRFWLSPYLTYVKP